MKNKWLFTGIAIVIVATGILACQPSAPVTPVVPTTPGPTAPTPVQTPPPATTSEPAPTGVIEITAEKLIRQFSSNPKYNEGDIFLYKEGTVLQISGTVLNSPPFDGTSLGPIVENSAGARFTVVIFIDNLSTIEGQRLYYKFHELNDGDWVTIRGEFGGWVPRDRGECFSKMFQLFRLLQSNSNDNDKKGAPK